MTRNDERMASNNRINLKLDSNACESIDAYLEYRRIVGDDDGGKLFTPAEYEAYKQKVYPMRIENRIFVSFVSNNSGIECKMIGPETICFCRHRYKQHKTDFKKIPSKCPLRLPCEVIGCGCQSYSYLASNGSQGIRCSCKHLSDDHTVGEPYRCKKAGCSCKAFHSSFGCGCGSPFFDHHMVIETKSERERRGKPLGKPVPYKAMGGLTGFSSLADGYMRLDSSGIGTPTREFLEQPPGPFDHPVLKIHTDLEKLCLKEEPNNAVSNMLTQEEKDMAYFEKRYQQRLKAERELSRAKYKKK